jgi:hypothetical protein
MNDFFNPSMLKFKATMDRPNGISDVPSPPPMPENNNSEFKDSVGQEDEITKLVGKLYTPGHEISDKFNEVWNQMPQREKPSVLRRIVASMVGINGGPEKAKEIVDEPYNEKMGEWTNKLKMLQPLLGDERYSNANERMLATSAASQLTANRRIDETIRKDKATEDINKEKLAVTKDRAAVYRYKAEHPDHKFQEDENGDLMALDPSSGTMHYVLNDDGVPVKSLKNLDQAEKTKLQIQGAIDAARARGIEERKTETTRQAGRIDLEKQKQQGRIEIKDNKDASGKIVSRTTTAYDADGNVTGSRTDSTTTTPVKPKKDGKVEIPSNVGKVKMSAPDGRTIMVPMDKVAEAEQRGAKRVK